MSEDSLDEWCAWRASAEPAAATVAVVLSRWQGAHGGQGDPILGTWLGRKLFDAMVDSEERIAPGVLVALVQHAVWDFDGALASVTALAGAELSNRGSYDSAWGAVLEVAEGEAALDQVLAAMGATAGYSACEAAVERLVEAGRLEDALAWLARVAWPSHRAKALGALMPMLSADQAEAELRAAWALAERVSFGLENVEHVRLAFFDALLELDRTPSRAARVAALARFVEDTPPADWETCQDHPHAAEIVARACARSGDAAAALGWAQRIDGDEARWSLPEIVAEMPPGPQRDALEQRALAVLEPGPDPDDAVDDVLLQRLAALSPTAAARVRDACADIADPMRRWVLTATLGDRGPSWVKQGLALVAALTDDEDGDDDAETLLDALDDETETLRAALVARLLRRFDPTRAVRIAPRVRGAEAVALLDAIERALPTDDWHVRGGLVEALRDLVPSVSAADLGRAERLLVEHGGPHVVHDEPRLSDEARLDLLTSAVRACRRSAGRDLAPGVLSAAFEVDRGGSTDWTARCAAALAGGGNEALDELVGCGDHARAALVGAFDRWTWPVFVGAVIGIESPGCRPLPEPWQPVARAVQDDASFAAWLDAQSAAVVGRTLGQLSPSALQSFWAFAVPAGPGLPWSDALLDVAGSDRARLLASGAEAWRARAHQRGLDALHALEQASAPDEVLQLALRPAVNWLEPDERDRLVEAFVRHSLRASTWDGDLLALADLFARDGDRARAERAVGLLVFPPYRQEARLRVACALGDDDEALAALLAMGGRPPSELLWTAMSAAESGAIGPVLGLADRCDRPGLTLGLRAVACADGTPEGWSRAGASRDAVLAEVERDVDALLEQPGPHAWFGQVARVVPHPVLLRLWQRAFDPSWRREACPLDRTSGSTVWEVAVRLRGPEILVEMACTAARLRV